MLTVTCLAAFLFFNSFGSISVALPAIQKQFGNSLSEIQWITLMGVVTISSLSFCFGRAGKQSIQCRGTGDPHGNLPGGIFVLQQFWQH